LPSVRGTATKKQQQQQQQHPHLANPTPSAKSLASVFACKTSTPTQGNKQGQQQKVRAWSGAYLQRAKARGKRRKKQRKTRRALRFVAFLVLAVGKVEFDDAD
jgi:hypothetical protein